MLQTLITGTIGPVPIYKSRPVPIQSTVDRMWFRISTKICSNSSCHPYFSICKAKCILHCRQICGMPFHFERSGISSVHGRL